MPRRTDNEADAREETGVTTRGQSATRMLRDAILNGEHPGGAHLNEIELAASLGVSRTPVRAALSTLAAEGLLEYTPNSGYVVRPYTAKDMLGVFEVRSVLEGLATRQAVENGLSDAQHGFLHKLLAETDAMIRSGQWDETVAARWSEVNDSFHATILAAADNAHLNLVLRKTKDVPMVSRIRFRYYNLDRIARSHEDHLDIFDALVNRQATRAEALAREHVYKSARFIVEQWRRYEPRRAERGSPATAA